MNKIISLIFTILIHSSFAAETDQFTRRDEALEDVSKKINSRVNEIVENVIEKQNNCDEIELYKNLRQYFGNHINGKLTKEILENKTLYPKRFLSISDSIYSNFSPRDGLGMGFKFMKNKEITISSVIRMNDIEVGTDKIEHFFGQGFYYFQDQYLKKKGLEKALKIGIAKEKFMLGGNVLGNGVFSYGDLAANFNGMRFWNHLLQKHVDVLGKNENLGPYISCQNNKFIQIKKIDLTDYFDHSMDEGINCSKFPRIETANKVKNNIAKLNLSCPVNQETLQHLKEKYGATSKWILNFDGLDKVEYLGEFN